MRTIATILFFSILTHVIGQAPAQETPSKPTQAEQPVNYQDFDFTYYPQEGYARYSRFLVVDSLTKAESVKRDSSTAAIRVQIEKQGDHLTIKNLNNLTETLYDQHVRFVGVSNDTYANLVYRAITQDQETIVVNPSRGYAILLFRKCKTKDDCDGLYHFFGKGAPALRP